MLTTNNIKFEKEFTIFLASRILIKMQWINSGQYLMGSPVDEPNREPLEENQFMSNITQGFWMSQLLITNSVWNLINDGVVASIDKFSQKPVVNISWDEAIAFCNQISKLLQDKIPEGYVFSLPSETEWEYVCRAGSDSMYHNGNTIEHLNDIAWFADNSNGNIQPVGTKLPNNWGFYDMHGNVNEWCLDSPSSYPDEPFNNWKGSGDENIKVIRGGSYRSPVYDVSLRCAGRGWVIRSTKSPTIGFRLCLHPQSN